MALWSQTCMIIHGDFIVCGTFNVKINGPFLIALAVDVGLGPCR